jgi:lipopolysaccharide export system protein LptA
MNRVESLSGFFRAGFLGLLGIFPLLLGPPASLAAQGMGECEVPSHQGFTSFTYGDGGRILYFSSPTFSCPGGTWISADSARVFEATNYTDLFGNVVFSDEDMRLTSDLAQYWADQLRLEAQGNVVLKNQAEGSVIRGDRMILLRAGDQRSEDQLTVTGRRPHATLYPVLQPDPDAIVLPPDSTVVAPDSAGVLPDEEAISTGADIPPGLQQPSGPEEGRTPYEIDADSIFLEGSQYFKAHGSVEIRRDSLNAFADSVEYDELESALHLGGSARLLTSDYDLSARFIRLDIPQDEVREVLAREDAVLVGEDLRLLAPIITLLLSEGKMEQLVAVRDPVADSLAAQEDSLVADESARRVSLHAVPALRDLGLEAFPVRPYAVAQDFLLQSDSMEVFAPGDVLEEVWAMGKARGESLSADSLNAPDTPPLFARDWLEGDTIVAYFGTGEEAVTPPDSVPTEADSVPKPPPVERDPMGLRQVPGDSLAPGAPSDGEFRLTRLVARVDARSFYRLAASDSAAVAEGAGPSFHYVIGEEITIFMSQGEVEKMEVTGRTRGIHLEPVIRRGAGGGQGGGEPAGSQRPRRSPGSGEVE